MFAPPALRLRTRPGHLKDSANVMLDKSVYAARHRDLRPPAAHVRLESFARLEDAEAIVHARYEHMAADDPALARNVFRSEVAELRAWHASEQPRSGQLQSVSRREQMSTGKITTT